MTNDIYLLDRDEEEAQRLNKQHVVFTENNGYVIHPFVLPRLPSNASIADVAAGSGAWTLDVANRVSPGSRVDGYDISAERFPTEPPQNATFSIHDAKQPFPSHLHGTYDLVHVRALVAAMNPSDWEPVIQNLTALIKPGGALQWTEANLSQLVCLRSGPATAKPFVAIPQLLATFDQVAHQRTAYGAQELPGLFAQAGLQSVQMDSVSSDRISDTRAVLSETYLVALLGWARKSGTMTGEELESMRLDILDEIARGAYVRGDMFTSIGIKP